MYCSIVESISTCLCVRFLSSLCIHAVLNNAILVKDFRFWICSLLDLYVGFAEMWNISCRLPPLLVLSLVNAYIFLRGANHLDVVYMAYAVTKIFTRPNENWIFLLRFLIIWPRSRIPSLEISKVFHVCVLEIVNHF